MYSIHVKIHRLLQLARYLHIYSTTVSTCTFILLFGMYLLALCKTVKSFLATPLRAIKLRAQSFGFSSLTALQMAAVGLTRISLSPFSPAAAAKRRRYRLAWR